MRHLLDDRVSFDNFKNYARIVDSVSEKNAPFSFERIQDAQCIKFVNVISKILMQSEPCRKFEHECERIQERDCSHFDDCPSRLDENKVFVFITPLVTETFLSNVNKGLQKLNTDVRAMPDVYTISIFESPGKEELELHIDSENAPNIDFLRALKRAGKWHYRSYLTRYELEYPEENPEILKLIYE